MTEKQFTVRHLEDANVDVIWSEKTKAIPLGYTGALVLCDLLNELVDENEQLKSEIKDLNDVLARYEEKELKE